MNTPPIVSREEWEAAREKLLVKEKELTRARDAMAAQRRRMPWMAVEKEYRFDGPNGPASLDDLFEGRRQMIVSRAFYGPEVTTYAEGASYFSTNPQSCANCHIMREQYDSWQKASHHANAKCIDCHLPHDFVGKYVAKAENGYPRPCDENP